MKANPQIRAPHLLSAPRQSCPHEWILAAWNTLWCCTLPWGFFTAARQGEDNATSGIGLVLVASVEVAGGQAGGHGGSQRHGQVVAHATF